MYVQDCCKKVLPVYQSMIQEEGKSLMSLGLSGSIYIYISTPMFEKCLYIIYLSNLSAAFFLSPPDTTIIWIWAYCFLSHKPFKLPSLFFTLTFLFLRMDGSNVLTLSFQFFFLLVLFYSAIEFLHYFFEYSIIFNSTFLGILK